MTFEKRILPQIYVPVLEMREFRKTNKDVYNKLFQKSNISAYLMNKED